MEMRRPLTIGFVAGLSALIGAYSLTSNHSTDQAPENVRVVKQPQSRTPAPMVDSKPTKKPPVDYSSNPTTKLSVETRPFINRHNWFKHDWLLTEDERYCFDKAYTYLGNITPGRNFSYLDLSDEETEEIRLYSEAMEGLADIHLNDYCIGFEAEKYDHNPHCDLGFYEYLDKIGAFDQLPTTPPIVAAHCKAYHSSPLESELEYRLKFALKHPDLSLKHTMDTYARIKREGVVAEIMDAIDFAKKSATEEMFFHDRVEKYLR